MALNAAAGPISPLPKTKIFIMKLLLSVLLAFSPVAFCHIPNLLIEQAHYTIVPQA
jgi:hypothetical protein